MTWLPVAILASAGVALVACLFVMHARSELETDEPRQGYGIADTSLAYVGATVAISIVAAVITGIAP